jgi:hypothetical protein
MMGAAHPAKKEGIPLRFRYPLARLLNNDGGGGGGAVSRALVKG